jgi:hypothetical protein
MQTLPFKVGQPAVDVARGVASVGAGVKDLAVAGAIPGLNTAMGTPLNPTKAAEGFNKVVEGSLEAGAPLIMPAMVAAPYFTPAMVGTAMFAQRKAVSYAKAQGWPEEYQRLAGNLATLVTLGVASPRVLKGFGDLAVVGKDVGAGAVKAIGETGRLRAGDEAQHGRDGCLGAQSPHDGPVVRRRACRPRRRASDAVRCHVCGTSTGLRNCPAHPRASTS